MSTRIDPDAVRATGTSPEAGAGDAPFAGSARVTPRTTSPLRNAPGTHPHLPPIPVDRSRRKAPLAWLPLAALAALAALVLLSLLVINAVDDAGRDGPAGDSLGQVSGSGGAGATELAE